MQCIIHFIIAQIVVTINNLEMTSYLSNHWVAFFCSCSHKLYTLYALVKLFIYISVYSPSLFFQHGSQSWLYRTLPVGIRQARCQLPVLLQSRVLERWRCCLPQSNTIYPGNTRLPLASLRVRDWCSDVGVPIIQAQVLEVHKCKCVWY